MSRTGPFDNVKDISIRLYHGQRSPMMERQRHSKIGRTKTFDNVKDKCVRGYGEQIFYWNHNMHFFRAFVVVISFCLLFLPSFFLYYNFLGTTVNFTNTRMYRAFNCN